MHVPFAVAVGELLVIAKRAVDVLIDLLERRQRELRDALSPVVLEEGNLLVVHLAAASQVHRLLLQLLTRDAGAQAVARRLPPGAQTRARIRRRTGRSRAIGGRRTEHSGSGRIRGTVNVREVADAEARVIEHRTQRFGRAVAQHPLGHERRRRTSFLVFGELAHLIVKLILLFAEFKQTPELFSFSL